VAASSPLVSIALPLFESRPFLPVIEANLRSLDYPCLEILVSDRHRRDDALTSLRRTFGRDSRFTFIEAFDELSWIAHYNALLRAAHGAYFMWMPHDDSFPPDYVSALVERLEAQPDAVLAFGRIDPIGRDDARLPQWFRPPPFGERPGWTIRDSLRLLFWHPAAPFRGVFRRAFVIEHDLWIPDTLDTVGADAYWVFALSLVGALTFVPSCGCRKRYHAGSTSAAFRPRWRHIADGVRRMHADVAARGRSRRDVAVGSMGVALWGAWWGLTLPARRLPVPAKLWLKAIAYGSTSRGQR
jgi:hypothetical protein